jgi:hypothetical protein
MIEVTTNATFSDLEAYFEDIPENTFVSYTFFNALEKSFSIGKDTGWLPFPLIAREEGKAIGFLPTFIKEHSYGEYVFDWVWAEAFHKHGLSYFPKIVCSIPFTPISGPRILAKDLEVKRMLIKALEKIMHQHKISSCHFLFTNSEDQKILNESGWMHRQGVQFRWTNKNYKTYDDFLNTLSQPKRKKIKQERKKLDSLNLNVIRKTGSNILEEDLQFFYKCYCNTYAIHKSTPYLTYDFFYEIYKKISNKILLIIAYDSDGPVGSALNIFDNNNLYGRYWGAIKYIPYLHFELCYYQGQEYCIENNLSIFEGGAQGEHKLARGFEPFETYSSHYIVNEEFRDAISKFLEEEGDRMSIYTNELEGRSPYKNE